MADQTFRRLEYDHYGKATEVLHFKTITGIPVPKEDEIVIKVVASPVHPSVLMQAQGKKAQEIFAFAQFTCLHNIYLFNFAIIIILRADIFYEPDRHIS